MVDKNKIIAFRHGIVDFLESNGITDKDFGDWPAEIIFCESFKDLSLMLAKDPVLIIASNDLIRKHGTLEEFLLMTETLIKFNGGNTKPAIGISFDKETTISEIKAIQKNSINLFPNLVSYGVEETKKAVETFLKTGKSYPKDLIEKLPGNKEKPTFKDVHLTGRQKQVYELIANRGLSNKQIAQVLKISESTVKIHVSAVMRALCVRNRTQLALTK
jgi:DNA-binding CsgD family transcriptional regulator